MIGLAINSCGEFSIMREDGSRVLLDSLHDSLDDALAEALFDDATAGEVYTALAAHLAVSMVNVWLGNHGPLGQELDAARKLIDQRGGVSKAAAEAGTAAVDLITNIIAHACLGLVQQLHSIPDTVEQSIESTVGGCSCSHCTAQRAKAQQPLDDLLASRHGEANNKEQSS